MGLRCCRVRANSTKLRGRPNSSIRSLLLIALSGGMAAWMFRVQSLLESIAAELKSLNKLWRRVDGHEERLDDHEVRISMAEGRP